MNFTKYNGKRKYHCRYYRKTGNHPFLVIIVTEEKEKNGKILISGFNITHSTMMVSRKPNRYIKLKKNPNPKDNKDSFVCINLVKDIDAKYFTSPIFGWDISKEDENVIDDVLSKKYPLIHKKLKKEG